MANSSVAPVTCPSCGANYKVVRVEAEPAFAGEPGAFAALLEQFDRVFAFNHFGLGGKSRPLPWLQRNGPSFPALSSRAGYLLMMIASLWIVKDLSTDNDRTAHGQESKNASQHPDHCRLPIPAFFISQRHNS